MAAPAHAEALQALDIYRNLQGDWVEKTSAATEVNSCERQRRRLRLDATGLVLLDEIVRDHRIEPSIWSVRLDAVPEEGDPSTTLPFRGGVETGGGFEGRLQRMLWIGMADADHMSLYWGYEETEASRLGGDPVVLVPHGAGAEWVRCGAISDPSGSEN